MEPEVFVYSPRKKILKNYHKIPFWFNTYEKIFSWECLQLEFFFTCKRFGLGLHFGTNHLIGNKIQNFLIGINIIFLSIDIEIKKKSKEK
jgi:hypothetical protein